MKRLGLVLCALALIASSCGVGVRQPATDITETSATLNGKAVSTIGGPGISFFTFGPAEGNTPPTPVKNIDFGDGHELPMSAAVDGLEPGTTYRYQACAGDAENGGLCSPVQTFKTAGTAVRAFRVYSQTCAGPNDFTQEGVLLNFEPNTDYGVHFEILEGGSGTGGRPVTTDDTGNAAIGSIGFTEPFRVRVVVWLDPDGDFVLDPGEETVVDEVYAADEPCTDAQPEEPSNS